MRVVLAEDSVLLREGLVRLLDAAGIEVVAAVGDAEELLRAVDEHRPDLVVTDVRMPPDAHRRGPARRAGAAPRSSPGRRSWCSPSTSRSGTPPSCSSHDTGGVGYLLKDRVADVDEFIDALRRVAAGGTALDPEVVAQLLLRGHSDPLDRLTPREQRGARADGRGPLQRRHRRGARVSESAVGKHINNIFTKLDLSPAEGDHRRVLAVLQFLKIRSLP